jgi:SAM-dependent methyltransferase
MDSDRDASRSGSHPVDAADHWDERYAAGTHKWDLGSPSPPLVHAIHRARLAGPGRALVPGCGFGHDARLLATHGFDTLGIDFAPRAVERARANARAVASKGVRFEVMDLFALPESLDGTMDLVFEQTCFCAIHPSRRDAYVDAMARVLSPGGLLLGLFYVIQPEDGPPFGTTEEEVLHRFTGSDLFRLETARRPEESVPARQGQEWLAHLRRTEHPSPERSNVRNPR